MFDSCGDYMEEDHCENAPCDTSNTGKCVWQVSLKWRFYFNSICKIIMLIMKNTKKLTADHRGICTCPKYCTDYTTEEEVYMFIKLTWIFFKKI